jgi:hypothetical protein
LKIWAVDSAARSAETGTYQVEPEETAIPQLLLLSHDRFENLKLFYFNFGGGAVIGFPRLSDVKNHNFNDVTSK